MRPGCWVVLRACGCRWCAASAVWLQERCQCTNGPLNDRRSFSRTVEPDQIRLFAEPDQLPSRVAAVLLRDERTRGRLVPPSVQQLDRLPIHEPAERAR